MTNDPTDRAPASSLPKKKVLFICLGNACRSPMAESIARRDAADIIECSSAGIMPLGFVPELTKTTLSSNGCSIERLESTPITREEWDAADLVINMSGIERYKAFPEPEKVEDWAVQDPYGADPAIYQTIYEDIRERIAKLAERFRNSAQGARSKKTDKQPIEGSRK